MDTGTKTMADLLKLVPTLKLVPPGKSAAGEVLLHTIPPSVDILKGKTCDEQGKFFDTNGNLIGELVEGDPKICKDFKVGLHGNIVNGNYCAIGRGRTLPAKVYVTLEPKTVAEPVASGPMSQSKSTTLSTDDMEIQTAGSDTTSGVMTPASSVDDEKEETPRTGGYMAHNGNTGAAEVTTAHPTEVHLNPPASDIAADYLLFALCMYCNRMILIRFPKPETLPELGANIGQHAFLFATACRACAKNQSPSQKERPDMGISADIIRYTHIYDCASRVAGEDVEIFVQDGAVGFMLATDLEEVLDTDCRIQGIDTSKEVLLSLSDVPKEKLLLSYVPGAFL